MSDPKAVAATEPATFTYSEKTLRDIDEVMSIHRYRRPKGSRTEQEFIDSHLIPLGVTSDTWGNLHYVIGENPTILFSSHTDTVHTCDGYQRVVMDDNTMILKLHTSEKSNCLGADDGAGIWLMMEMIRAKIPGHYIFHYGEEKGCEGSTLLAKEAPHIFKNIRIAIAFDRKNVGDVITHMGVDRVCSDAFADSLIEQLPPGYTKCQHGSRTDVKLYEKLIPECVNISVCYYSPHSALETLSLRGLFRLRDSLLTMDFSKLVVARDPSKPEVRSYGQATNYTRGHHAAADYYGAARSGVQQPVKHEQEVYTFMSLLRHAPHTVADMMEAAGVNFDYFMSLVMEFQEENPGRVYTDFNKKVNGGRSYVDPRKPKTEPKAATPPATTPAVTVPAATDPITRGKDVAPRHIHQTDGRGGGAPPSNVTHLNRTPDSVLPKVG